MTHRTEVDTSETVNDEASSRPFLRVRGRSFLALVLTPEAPLDAWLAELDTQMRRSPAVLAGRAVVLDATGIPDDDLGAPTLLASLRERGIHLIGVEGSNAAWAAPEVWQRQPMPRAPVPESAPEEPPPVPVESGPTTLTRTEPLRSGQSVVFGEGDVTIVGSVASGAEVFAGGSIHVYGTLRGRAIAGFTGNSDARIFCRRFEAELLAIDGVYRTADDMGDDLRGRAVQAWLDGDRIVIAALDP